MTTNYERIKNMTVEEMAELLGGSEVIPCENCNKLPAPQYCNKEDCIDTAKQWLQSESED